MLFRQPSFDYSEASANEMKALAKRWQDWVSSIEAQGRLTSRGPRLSLGGKVLRSGGVITDGPFVEVKEIVGGSIIVRADSLDEATTLAQGCPALDAGGSVEIRPLVG